MLKRRFRALLGLAIIVALAVGLWIHHFQLKREPADFDTNTRLVVWMMMSRPPHVF